MTLIRPGTLAQVLQFVREGEKFRFCFAGFLDEFYGDTLPGSRLARVSEDPGLTLDPKTDTLVGAIREHLALRWNVREVPQWTCQRAFSVRALVYGA